MATGDPPVVTYPLYYYPPYWNGAGYGYCPNTNVTINNAFPGTLRDWFAGQALAGLLGMRRTDCPTIQEYAEGAYAYADAMLKAREGK